MTNMISATNGTNGTSNSNGVHSTGNTDGTNGTISIPSTNGLNGTASTHLQNGQHSTPDAPLTVLVAGAGLGGLAAAIGLRHQGHNVKIYEQSQFAAELGAAVHLGPNTNGALRKLGIYPETSGANPMNKLIECDSQGKVLVTRDLRQVNRMWQHEWLLAHRVHLHDALKKRATGVEGKGKPAELHTRSKVKSVDESRGTITLETGQTIEGDVIIGADGVHSGTRKKIAPNTEPFGCDKSAFRFLVPREAIKNDPVTSHLINEDGELTFWYDSDRRIVLYPTSYNQLFNFVCIHPAAESNASAGWNQEASMETLLKVYQSFNPAVLALLRKADPKELKVWSLLDMEEIPHWNKEKLALLGDAAHPFLPHQGQGAGQAIEDGVALSVVLPLGTRPEEVPERLQLYDEIRHFRATKIQDFSRIMGSDNSQDKKDLDMLGFTAFNFGHDEFDYAGQRLREFQWSKTPNKYWRMPLAFGPMPGPRQNHLGLPHSDTAATFTTASIRFKTSRTVLQNLFPPGRSGYRFLSPATVAQASFVQTTLNGLDWLGGGGYNLLSLYIHGTEYTKPDGSGAKVQGTYVPILFESLADPIITGREELGMPKVYSAIDIFRRGDNAYHIRTSWQGAVWGDFHLTGLEQAHQETEESPNEGLIVHRYIPSVGKESKGVKAEADYACFANPSSTFKVGKMWKASEAKFEIHGLDWKSLPTLHHITSRLAELPVYEVVWAKVVEGVGADDFSRLEAV